MKYINTIFTFMLCIAVHYISAQTNESLTVPLSDPSAPGHLQLHTHNGTISIEGYSGNEIQMEVISHDKGDKKDNGSKKGLRRIPKQSMDVSISEENNRVKINGSNNSRADFKLKIPENFSLQLSSHHNGNISVSNVAGEIEVNSHHGWISLEDISGSVIADTHHGAITVSFVEVDSDAAMAFTTYHGDVDITFPGGVGADLKMKSSKGNVYTDFDFEPVASKLETSTKGTRKEIKLGGWTQGKLGSGGEEMMFKTYHGDILIRKR